MKIKALLISEEISNIDFNEIKKNNIKMIFIRLGYTSYGKTKEKLKDCRFNINYNNIIKHKIPVGLYYESRAVTTKEAKEEAEYFLQLLKENNLSNPISVLISDTHSTIIYSNKNQMDLPKKELTNVVLAFCNKMNEYNKNIIITSYKSWFDNILNDERILNYDISILSDDFNNTESRLYNLYNDNIIYLCDNVDNNKIEIKLESNCMVDKIKSIINIPFKFIRNKLK